MSHVVLIVIGTRPEAIKLAPVLRAMEKHPGITPIVCATGQHQELLDESLDQFSIKPKHVLGIMKPDQSLSETTSDLLISVSAVLIEEQPDCVVVQGDTLTAMAGGLAAFYLNIPVAHVEAGLRTWRNSDPFPEEVNRVILDHISSILFAPTNAARDNLIKEGLPESILHVTGNTGIDALSIVRAAQEGEQSHWREIFRERYGLDLDGKRLITVTSHRRENFGEGLRGICRGIKNIVERNSDIEIVLPVHPNPNVQGHVKAFLEDIESVHLVEPLRYDAMVALMSLSTMILTDSGGIQEEAPYLGKPVLILRNVTERPEGVASGNSMLVGLSGENIANVVQKILDDPELYQRMSKVNTPYGDGHAAERITGVISNWLSDRETALGAYPV